MASVPKESDLVVHSAGVVAKTDLIATASKNAKEIPSLKPAALALSSSAQLRRDELLELDAFFEAREKRKRRSYLAAVAIGWSLILLGFLGTVAGNVWQNIASSDIAPFVNIFFQEFLTLGVCIVSIVPVDEFDLDVEIARSPCIGRIVYIVGGAFTGACGIILITQYPYVQGILFCLHSALFFLRMGDVVTVPFTALAVMVSINIGIAGASFFFQLYFAPGGHLFKMPFSRASFLPSLRSQKRKPPHSSSLTTLSSACSCF